MTDRCVAGPASPFSLERLSAFVDGDLSASETQSVRHHLEACPACARRADELGALTRATRALEVPEPPPTLWPSIEGALERRGGADAPGGWWASWRSFGIGALAGAVAVAVIVAGFGARGRAPGAGPDGALVAHAPEGAPALQALQPSSDPLLADAEQEFARAAAVYERSIEKLRRLLVREEVRWSPEVRARYDERLARLDDAIARSRDVARRAPSDSDGNERLFAAYQQKIAFLSDTVHRGGGWGPGAP